MLWPQNTAANLCSGLKQRRNERKLLDYEYISQVDVQMRLFTGCSFHWKLTKDTEIKST